MSRKTFLANHQRQRLALGLAPNKPPVVSDREAAWGRVVLLAVKQLVATEPYDVDDLAAVTLAVGEFGKQFGKPLSVEDWIALAEASFEENV